MSSSSNTLDSKLMRLDVSLRKGVRGNEKRLHKEENGNVTRGAAPAVEEGVLLAKEASVGPGVRNALQHESQKEHEHVQNEEAGENDKLSADGANETAWCFQAIR
jgi:hypothetical protein